MLSLWCTAVQSCPANTHVSVSPDYFKRSSWSVIKIKYKIKRCRSSACSLIFTSTNPWRFALRWPYFGDFYIYLWPQSGQPHGSLTHVPFQHVYTCPLCVSASQWSDACVCVPVLILHTYPPQKKEDWGFAWERHSQNTFTFHSFNLGSVMQKLSFCMQLVLGWV